MLKTCRKPSWSIGVAIVRDDRALSAAGVATVIAPCSGRSMIWETWSRSDHATFRSPIRNITAVSAGSISTRICWTWLRPKATTRVALLPWQYGWWWRTACPTGRPVGTSGEITACSSLSPQFRTGWRAGGKKAQQHVATEYLDAVLAEFSGYIAADELYDGPFCVLSIVDNRTFRRITYEVLDHDPTHADIVRFFRMFHSVLEQRGLTLRGITTDGSALYPEPISKVFGDVPHQLCEFHVIKELTKAVLRAVAKVRKELAATKPKLGRGRPSSVAARKKSATPQTD